MTNNSNEESHQLKISKLQERLGSISSEFRKNLAETHEERQGDFESPYFTPRVTHSQQKQVPSESKKESIKDEMQQQSRQSKNYQATETQEIITDQQIKQEDELPSERIRDLENRQKSKGVITSKKLEDREPDEISNKQKVIQESKSWQPWKSIPKEKLSQLEKKKLSRLFKKR